jgi:hypothetical protein
VAVTLSLTLRPSTQLTTGDVVVVSGLLGSGTVNNAMLAVGGSGQFGTTAQWVQGTGTLTLTATSNVLTTADSLVTLSLVNPASGSAGVTPSIRTSLSSSVIILANPLQTLTFSAASGPAFASKFRVSASLCLRLFAQLVRCCLARCPWISAVRTWVANTAIADSTSLPSASNLVILTINPSFAISSGSVLTLSGLTFLTGGVTALDINGAGAALLTGGPSNEGTLTGVADTLTFTVGASPIPSGSDTVFTFSLTNPATAPDAGLMATIGLRVTNGADIGFTLQYPFLLGSPNVFRGGCALPAPRLAVPCFSRPGYCGARMLTALRAVVRSERFQHQDDQLCWQRHQRDSHRDAVVATVVRSDLGDDNHHHRADRHGPGWLGGADGPRCRRRHPVGDWLGPSDGRADADCRQQPGPEWRAHSRRFHADERPCRASRCDSDHSSWSGDQGRNRITGDGWLGAAR